MCTPFGPRCSVADRRYPRIARNASSRRNGSQYCVRQFLVVDAKSREPLCQAGMSFYPDVKVAFLFAGGRWKPLVVAGRTRRWWLLGSHMPVRQASNMSASLREKELQHPSSPVKDLNTTESYRIGPLINRSRTHTHLRAANQSFTANPVAKGQGFRRSMGTDL